MRILLLPLVMGLCACTSMAPTSSNSHSSVIPVSAALQVSATAVFTTDDIQIIRDYYQTSA